MRCTSYPRVPRAILCAALLLSQHAAVDANNWATRRGSSTRSSTLAVMQPGGRNRPVRDWKAIKRESEEKLKKQAEDKANEKARQAGELVEAVQDEGEEAVDTAADAVDQAEIPALDLDEVKAENVGITLAKVAVIATAGMYGAKKVVAFAKAFIKARKESAEEGQEMSAITTMNDINDDDEDNDQEGGEAEQVQVDGGEKEEEDVAVGEGEIGDESGFVTADEDEEDGTQGASAMLEGVSKAAKDVKERAESGLENLKSTIGDAVDREGDAEGGVEGGLRSHLPQGAEGGKGDVSYV